MDSLTVLLILKHTDGVSYNNNTEPKKPQSDKKRTPSRSRKRKREVSLDSMEEDKDPLRTEVMFYEKLFTQTPDALMKNEELISAVYRTCKYQASAYPHKASVLEDAQKFLESLYDYQVSICFFCIVLLVFKNNLRINLVFPSSTSSNSGYLRRSPWCCSSCS